MQKSSPDVSIVIIFTIWAQIWAALFNLRWLVWSNRSMVRKPASQKKWAQKRQFQFWPETTTKTMFLGSPNHISRCSCMQLFICGHRLHSYRQLEHQQAFQHHAPNCSEYDYSSAAVKSTMWLLGAIRPRQSTQLGESFSNLVSDHINSKLSHLGITLKYLSAFGVWCSNLATFVWHSCPVFPQLCKK